MTDLQPAVKHSQPQALPTSPDPAQTTLSPSSAEPQTRKISLHEAVELHSEKLFIYANYLCRDPDLSQDLVQETYLRATRAWHQFDGRHPRAYLKRILRNLFLAHREQEGRKRPLTVHGGDSGEEEQLSLLDMIPAAEPRWAPPAPEHWESLGWEVDGPIMDALRELPEDWRALLILRELHGFSYRELAEHFSIKDGTVMSRLSRTRRRLRESLQATNYHMRRSA